MRHQVTLSNRNRNRNRRADTRAYNGRGRPWGISPGPGVHSVA